MNANARFFVPFILAVAATVFGAAGEPFESPLPPIPRQLASYDPKGGRNLTDRVRVNPASGELRYVETDLTIPGAPSAPRLQRFYSSSSPTEEPGLFGRGWRCGFERRLAVVNKDTYRCADEWGGTWLFSKRPGGQWWAERGPAQWLETTGDTLVLHDGEGGTWRFDAGGWLIAASDGAGRRLVIERDPEQPASIRSVRDDYGNALSFQLDARGLVEAVSASDGRRVAYEYRNGSLAAVRSENASITRYTYNDTNRLSEAALPNGSQLLIRSDARGRVVKLSGRGIATRTYSYSEPSSGTETLTEGIRTDALGNKTQWQVSDNGRRLAVTPEPLETWILEKNDRGLPARLSLGGSLAWTWKYDTVGRPLSVKGPQGETIRLAYSGNRLQPDRVERPDGSIVRSEFNAEERCVAWSAGNLRPWRREFDDKGRLAAFENHFHRRFEIAYDSKGRIRSLRDPAGTAFVIGRDGMGRMETMGQKGGPTLSFRRDEAGQIRHVTDGAESLRLAFNVSDNVTSVVGSQGWLRRYYYNTEGLPLLLQGADERVPRLFYDGEGNCIAFQHGDRNAFHATRGAAGRILALDAAGIARWTVRYDTIGRPIACLKSGYDERRLEYDSAGRLRSLLSPSGQWTTECDLLGRLAALETPLARIRLAFDFSGRLLSLVETNTAKRDALDYDDANHVLRRSAPGWTERYQIDREGRIAAVTIAQRTSQEYGFEYNEAGWVAGIRYPNGLTSVFDYDAKHRLTRVGVREGQGQMLFTKAVDYVTSSRLAAATGSGGDRFDYRYSSNLDFAEITRPGGGREVFEYDRQGRPLFVARDGQREDFRYDALGRPVQVGARRYIYLGPRDSIPALTTGTTALVLDDREQVIALERGDGLKAKYGYLPDGRMIRREVAGRITSFDWDGLRLRAISDGNGRLVVGIHYDPEFGLPLAVVLGGRTFFCHPDPFGHPALLTDEKGKPVDPPRGFPFQIKSRFEPPISPTWEGMPPAIRLPEEDLWLVRGRLYDPRSGDFLSPDLARFVESENPYRTGTIPRPIELTRTWDDLYLVLRWVENIENGGLGARWHDRQMADGDGLADWSRYARRPEAIERRLLERAWQSRFNPDWWFESVPLMSVPRESCSFLGRIEALPTFADLYSRFSPLGAIPCRPAAVGWSPNGLLDDAMTR